MPVVPNPGFTEAVAVGSLYRVLQDPSLAGVEFRKPAALAGRSLQATVVEGHSLAPVSALVAAGVRIQKEGRATRLSFGNRWIRLTPFEWTATTSAGKIDLDLCAFNGNDGLVVPIETVAKALGMGYRAP
jgi:hypothetical protein